MITLINPTTSASSPPNIIGSGVTGHFFQISHQLDDLTPPSTSIKVTLPDGTAIASSHTSLLPFPGLLPEAHLAHISSSLQ
jgi:hypothetical protein